MGSTILSREKKGASLPSLRRLEANIANNNEKQRKHANVCVARGCHVIHDLFLVPMN